jgi:hypothetical protein
VIALLRMSQAAPAAFNQMAPVCQPAPGPFEAAYLKEVRSTFLSGIRIRNNMSDIFSAMFVLAL